MFKPTLALAGALAFSTTVLQAGLIQISSELPQASTPAGEYTALLNILPNLVGSPLIPQPVPKPNGAWVYATPSSAPTSGDELGPVDTLTIPNLAIAGEKLTFGPTDPMYFLVKSAVFRTVYFYYYDGVGKVEDLVSPFTDSSGTPQAYSHVTFFGLGSQSTDPGNSMPDGGLPIALLGLGLLGVAGARRTARSA